MSTEYGLKGTFDIAPIINGLKDLAQKARESGKSVKELLATDKEAQQFIKQLKEAQGAIAKVKKELKEANTGKGVVDSKAVDEGTKSVGKMNMALGQFGYLVGDADMFLMNFRMGMMSVANNVPMVVQFMQYARQEANELGMTFRQSLVKSLVGPGGLLVAVNAAMFTMNILGHVFARTTKEAKIQNDEIKKLAAEYRKLTREQLQYRMFDIQKELSDYEKKYPVQYKTLPSFDITRAFGGQSPFVREQVSDEKRFGDDYATVKLLKEQNAEIQRQLLYRGDIQDAQLRMSSNQEKLNSLTKDNYSLIVVGAKSLKDAESTLKKWIEADKKIVDEGKNIGDGKEKNLIRTDAQILKEIELAKIEMGRAKSAREIAEYWKLIYKLHNELNPPTTEKARKLEQQKTSMPDTSQLKSLDEIVAAKAERDKPDPYLDDQKESVKELNTAWKTVGNTMINSLTGSLRLFKENNNAILNMIDSLFQLGLKAAFVGALTALIPGGGGFMSGFLGALGVTTKMADGGITTEPIFGIGKNTGRRYEIGEAGSEAVIPLQKFFKPSLSRTQIERPQTMNIKLSGELTGNGKSLHAIIKRIDRIEKRYGKS